MHKCAEEKKELLELAQMVKSNCPYLTAADFFVIDRSVIFKVFSITTTYFIVIIQFHSKSS